MKKNCVCLFLFFLSINCFSQKQGNNWYFGVMSGLTFSTGSPVAVTGGKTGSALTPGNNQEGTSCISDSSGALLFYCDGENMWNKLHQLMPNGQGIQGGSSSTQAALIVPQPGNDSLFYVFTSDQYQSNPNKGYRYSVVNMCLDNKKGDVVQGKKNILLSDSCTEKLAACRDSSGSGYWIVGHKRHSNLFLAWHLTSAGITATVISGVGTVHGKIATNTWATGAEIGQMKINRTGTRLALVIGNKLPAVLEYFDFSSLTGVISNPCHLVVDSSLNKLIYGIEFSPDGTKMYATLSGGSGGNLLYQFDLNFAACLPALFQIYQSNGPPLSGMQLGPDNKIYVMGPPNNYLSCINAPNLQGTACNFVSPSFVLSGPGSQYMLPSFVAGYRYSNNRVLCCTPPTLSLTSSSASLCAGNQVTLSAQGASNYTWSGGATAPIIQVSPTVSTVYSVTSTNTITSCLTTLSVSLLVYNSNFSVSGSTLICSGNSVTLTATGAAQSYSWGVNVATTGTIVIVSPTISTTYNVIGADGSCLSIQSISITVNPLPALTAISSADIVCSGEIFTLTAGGASGYNWSTGAASSAITLSLSNSATFTISGTTNGCSDTITITQLVSLCDDLMELENADDLLIVYPNPSAEELMIQTKSAMGLEIINELGETIKYLDSKNEKDLKISVRDISPGIYFIKAQRDKVRIYRKIAVSR